MKLVIIVCGLIGIYRGLQNMHLAKMGKFPTVPPSNSLIEFVFLNR